MPSDTTMGVYTKKKYKELFNDVESIKAKSDNGYHFGDHEWYWCKYHAKTKDPSQIGQTEVSVEHNIDCCYQSFPNPKAQFYISKILSLN